MIKLLLVGLVVILTTTACETSRCKLKFVCDPPTTDEVVPSKMG